MIGAGPNEVIDAWTTAGLLSREAIREAEQNGVWRGETNIVARTGSRLPVLQTVVAHRSDEGDIRFFSVLARDISERYALEQMKNEFVANITHELRSPLTAVIGYLELLMDGAFGDLPVEAFAALEDVNGSAHVLMELINDLLALWRAEGRGTGDPEDLDLAEVVAAAVKTMEPVAAGKRISVVFSGEDVLTVGDRRQLERAFLNLVSNAVKFTPEGGDVRVRVGAKDGYGRVEIADSGVGIPASEIDSIFDRFFRASTAEDAGIPGTGLGLPLVRAVITAHGGDIIVRSTVGEGTTFSVELPTLVRTPVAA
jgi:signal transduction histidine kinase